MPQHENTICRHHFHLCFYWFSSPLFVCCHSTRKRIQHFVKKLVVGFFSFLLYISLCWIFKYAKINPRCMFFRIFSFNLCPNKVNIASKLFKNVESRSTTKFSINVVKLQIIGENWKIGITMNLNQFKQNMKNQQHRF